MPESLQIEIHQSSLSNSLQKSNFKIVIKNPKRKLTYLATALARSGWEFPDKITLPLWSIFPREYYFICNVIRQKELVFFSGGREGSYQFALLLWLLFNFVVDIFFCGVTLAVLERLGKQVFPIAAVWNFKKRQNYDLFSGKYYKSTR